MFQSTWCHQVQPQIVQELSDALVQIWGEIPQDTICHCQTCRWGHTNSKVPFWVAEMKFCQNALASRIFFFHFDFWGVFEFSIVWGDNFNSHQTIWHPFNFVLWELKYVVKSLHLQVTSKWRMSWISDFVSEALCRFALRTGSQLYKHPAYTQCC